MKVSLRQRKKGNKISLYLDYYNKGNREYEYLKLYLFPTPEKGQLTKAQKEENKKNTNLAESIRSKRHLELQNGIYGFQNKEKLNGSFIIYMQSLADKRKDSKGNYANWDSVIKHLKKFSPRDITFEMVNRDFVQSFKEYLDKDARTKSNKGLSQNSKYSYFNKMRAAIKQAVKDDILLKNPAEQVTGFKQGEPQREFLTLEELQKIANTECDTPNIKNAFLFSSLTGLRWSDIQKLTWTEVQHSNEMGNYIRFTQQKTKGVETLPISDQARKLLGVEKEKKDRVFKGLKYSAWHNMKLQQWVMKAGISKTVTFHVARHTYATLQLTLGTDIYTVSKLLGHKELKTTQIYARVIDQKKKEAANKIKINL